MPGNRANRTPKRRRDWKPDWLAAFAEHGTVCKACEVAKVARSTAYEGRTDEQFAEMWDEIEAATTDAMEREAYRRAVEGVERPVWQGGKLMGTVAEYSDTLLIFMLKGRKPEVYRDNVRVEHSGPSGGPIELAPPGQQLDLSARAARLLVEAGAAENGDGHENDSNGHR
jgi:hypothetical protein